MMTAYDYERHERISDGMHRGTEFSNDANRCIEAFLTTKDIYCLKRANEYFARCKEEYQDVLDAIEGRRNDSKGDIGQ